MEKLITVGIPAFKAKQHISDCLSSIMIQSIRDKVSIIIAKDNPNDNYKFLLHQFPKLDIKILECEKNTGPGLARQRCLDACTTDWITFIDADDIFYGPLALEMLLAGTNGQGIIEVQGTFLQEIKDPNPQGIRAMPINNPTHPWVFGRLYNAKFLKSQEIGFSSLRAMEDGELNWKIRMTIEGTQFRINILDQQVYFWRTGSDHSITRIGMDDNNMPQYNFDLCQWGATLASINAIKFCRKKNPFNGSINRFALEMMVGHYFTYIECLDKKPVFAEQNLFNSKKFYHECYKDIENQFDEKIVKDMYTLQLATKAKDLIGIIPSITFFEFMDKIKTEEYRGDEEFKEIRNRLPQEIIDNDIKCGVSGIECVMDDTLNKDDTEE